MNEDMINRWNSSVEDGDTVIHLGDFAMGQVQVGEQSYEDILKRLKGDIYLIAGNHDNGKVKELFRSKNRLLMESISTRIQQFRVLCQHYPVYPAGMCTREADPFQDNHNPKNISDPQKHRILGEDFYDFYLTGHIHNNYSHNEFGKKIGRLWSGKSLNLSVELHAFFPVSEAEVFNHLRERVLTLDRAIIIHGDGSETNDVKPSLDS